HCDDRCDEPLGWRSPAAVRTPTRTAAQAGAGRLHCHYTRRPGQCSCFAKSRDRKAKPQPADLYFTHESAALETTRRSVLSVSQRKQPINRAANWRFLRDWKYSLIYQVIE